MKHRSLLFLASAAILLAAQSVDAQSPAPSPTPTPPCPGFGWAEGLVKYTAYPAPPFPTSDTANVNAQDCAFHQWSWEAFVWATAIGPDGRARFTSLHNVDELGKKAVAAKGPKPLSLKPRDLKPKGASANRGGDDPQQAGGGVLVDQDGQIVWYSTHMNDAYFQFVQQNGGAGYSKAANTLNFPVGAAVFKASWKVVPAGATPTGFYMEKSTVPLLINKKGGGIAIDPSGKTRPVTVALVGLHVVGVTDNHPEFLWGTFEQVQNAPDLPPNMQPNSSDPVSAQGFTFYKANTPAIACNSPSPAPSVDPAKQTVAPVTNVFRQFATGNAAANRTADITAINSGAQGEMANMGTFKPPQPKETVWANYKLIGTLWLQANTLKPDNGNMVPEGVGSVNLANATLETYFQGQGFSCFLCHNTGGSTSPKKPYPGKDINISHVILNAIPASSATPTPSPSPKTKY
ncbi:MAG: hypothetical protein QOI07_2856 [Verrucomicrobiota bacterium]